VIKLTTLTGLIIIALDVLILMGAMSINNLSMIFKNVFSILNAILFSLSCTFYVFKFNQDVLHNDITNLCDYYKNSDLRIKGLEIIEATEKLDLNDEERFEFRDSILFRAKLKHCGLILEILFFYFNAMAYGKIYYHTTNSGELESPQAIYMLNLYISVISPILSILFSYITVLCDNIIVVKDFVEVITDNRDKEDELMLMLKRIVKYPIISVLDCTEEQESNEPVE